MKRLAPVIAFAAAAALGPLFADTVSDVLKADLARERRRLAADASQLADVSHRLETAASELSAASRAVADLAGRADASPEEITRREDAVTGAEQELRTLLDRRRIVVERILERRRNVALLDAELRGKARPAAPADLLTGRWTVTLEPGEQRGVFRMALDGTLVSGDYTLEGGFSGSLRGTLIGDRLRIERVDSQLGFVGIFYGRLARDGSSITGTWESTTFGAGAAGAGRWRATPVKEETEESP
ncbi:MAG TPA: hypothetical protein VGK86_07285 [Thermoanaerobaculia bacterium]|jgi:hypothetical protein